ncbi:hypothetical protein PAAG_11666 [Paracoccidioides lutzii Pb01]|uniref:Uncharacterized protein n=1 Tax=Paracoccidioides lutzii (strain ATCC MYA-826 / Pb01) TaxID=502779 RepID=A0A0A2V2J4_PARBA|nr:hypothetical protein PAAG_11666 [Paracoccidioides lutzii Pb01]KGQ01673.1 hypothetical protein PAAG_11666 [Paracoccidioides lutzii Pb01]
MVKVDSKVRIFPEERMDPSSSICTMAEIAGVLHPWFNHHCRDPVWRGSDSQQVWIGRRCRAESSAPHVSGTLYFAHGGH